MVTRSVGFEVLVVLGYRTLGSPQADAIERSIKADAVCGEVELSKKL